MPAYVVVTAEVTDREAFKNEFLPKADEILAKHHGKRIGVGSGDTLRVFRSGDGDPTNHVVILEFPNETTVINWWDEMEGVDNSSLGAAVFGVAATE